MVWPIEAKIVHIDGLLPAVIIKKSDRYVLSETVTSHFASIFLMAVTRQLSLISTLCFLQILMKHSMIVSEESVMGNILPSASVFKATPFLENQSMVSLG